MLILLLLFISLILVYKLKNEKDINLFIEAIIKNKSIKIENNNVYNFAEKKVSFNRGDKSNEKIVEVSAIKKKKRKRKAKKNMTVKETKIITNVIINMKPKNTNNNPPRKKRKKYTVSGSPSINLLNNNIDENTSPSIYIPFQIKHKTENFNIIDDNKIKEKNDPNEIQTNQNNDIQKNDRSKKEELINEEKTNSKTKIKGNQAPKYSNQLKEKENGLEMKYLNDEEINSLEYEQAIKYDKRTYFQYYISLIKKKQLIIFTFFSSSDYNLLSLKISLFIVSFSLYLTVNGFFFNDDSMHKIYQNKGSYNILYRIPKIFYSSIICILMNILLKILSLSENDLLKIKQEKDTNLAMKKAKNIEKCIKIKFLIFFIISLLLMLFFWYFISCFCAVYRNTQFILFKDTIISFALSMLYPFGINLIPGFFRMPALKAEQKDKKNLYIFSQYVALL